MKIKYLELTSEKQGTIGQLYKLYRENSEISILDEKRLMEFKCKFIYIAQKYLRSPAIIKNYELVELFVQCLDITFQDALNSRLSVQGTLKINA